MATRSFISKRNQDAGSYDGVYCHWDGYPDGVGATLKEYYTTSKKVEALIDGGSISELGSTVEETKFYHKWRNDPLTISRELVGKNYLKQYATELGCKHLYVFEDGVWTHTEL